MDCPSADPNTRTEVDLMILDYILCTTISGLLSTREAESLAWALDTIDCMLQNKPPPSPPVRGKHAGGSD